MPTKISEHKDAAVAKSVDGRIQDDAVNITAMGPPLASRSKHRNAKKRRSADTFTSFTGFSPVFFILFLAWMLVSL